MNVSELISSLVQYGLDCALIEPCDTNFITNQLLQALVAGSLSLPPHGFGLNPFGWGYFLHHAPSQPLPAALVVLGYC